MRGVVAQWYHWADKSATATRDPAPSPAGCGSDFPKLSAQRPAVSVYCPLILQQALRKALLIYLQGTFRHRGWNERERWWEAGSGWKWLKQKEQRARDKRKNTMFKNIPLILFSLSEWCFFLSPWKPVLFRVSLWFVGRVAGILCLSFPPGCFLGDD